MVDNNETIESVPVEQDASSLQALIDMIYELRGRIAILERDASSPIAEQALTLASQSLARDTNSMTLEEGPYDPSMAFELVPRIGNTVGLYSGNVYHGATLLTESEDIGGGPPVFDYMPTTITITGETYIWIEHYRQARIWTMKMASTEPVENVNYGYTMLYKLAWDSTNETIDVENSLRYHPGGHVYLGGGPPTAAIGDDSDMVYRGDEDEGSEARTVEANFTLDGTTGVTVHRMTRIGYFDSGDQILYGYIRTFVYDRFGQLKSISSETRIAIDAPVIV